VFFEGCGAPGKGSTGTGEIAECVDLSTGLPDDFRSGVEVMSSKITFELKLIGAKGIAFFLFFNGMEF
jgi:hypothetical protein